MKKKSKARTPIMAVKIAGRRPPPECNYHNGEEVEHGEICRDMNDFTSQR